LDKPKFIGPKVLGRIGIFNLAWKFGRPEEKKGAFFGARKGRKKGLKNFWEKFPGVKEHLWGNKPSFQPNI